MLTRGGVKLLDFFINGYRAPEGPTPGVTTASAAWAEPELAGTLPYMAPEQLEGRTIDRRADIFTWVRCCSRWSPEAAPFKAPLRRR